MLKKSFLVIGIVLTLLIASVAPVFATPEGSITGTFGINAPPTVDSVILTPIAMDPQSEYSVSVQVTETDTINDLSTVVLKLWYDSDGTAPTGVKFDGQSADVQNCAVITWTATEAGGTSYDGSAALTPAGTSWSLGTCTLPQKQPGDFGLTTFTFSFGFTVGKVATETTGPALWQIAAEATDSKSQVSAWSVNSYDADGTAMDFYGEISVPGGITVSWAGLAPGTNFDDDTASEQAVGDTISYIANGAYDKQVKTHGAGGPADATWHGATDNAILDATGVCDDSQEFALKASVDGTLTNAQLVDTAGVVIEGTGGQTTEATDPVSTMTLWLKLNSSFAKDTYTGTITYIVANHV